MTTKTIRKRILSALTAAVVATSAVPAALLMPVSAEYREHNPNDRVMTDDFFYKGITEIAQQNLTTAFERAVGKTLLEITYGDLENITTLDLSGMQLEEIPEAIQYMYRLRTLNLSDNLLTSGSLNRVNLLTCISLTSLDLSNNYITTVPAWYVSLDAARKNISDNLMNTTDQRYIESTSPTLYFMDGDKINENKLKNQILASIRLNDGTELPTFFYNPLDPSYDEYDNFNKDIVSEASHPLEIVKWDISKYVTMDDDGISTVKSAKATSVSIPITLYYGKDSTTNKNTNTTVSIYFLNSSDSNSFKIRLETLINQCKSITKTDYTASSWAKFETALKTAQTIYGYAGADADMIKDALTALENAKAGLVKGVTAATKKVLNDLVNIAKSYKEADYTVKSWKAFSTAVDHLKEAATDANTSVTIANAAIREFQRAQAGLTPTELKIPDMASKEDFDKIYGLDQNVTYSGVTRDGYPYKWVFNGKNITEPKAFNPEIKYQSENEETIRYQVGSAKDYQIISFVEKGSFPGKADITLDISEKYKDGTYRLYKWNDSQKKGEFVQNVTVKSGSVTLSLAEGGDYFISSVLQNFNIISNIFTIDNSKLTISCAFKSRYTVGEFKASLENGSSVTVKHVDGTEALDNEFIATGMTAAAPNSDTNYTIVLPGDINGDGRVNALDAVEILRAIIGEITLDTYAQKLAGDVNGDKIVKPDDAVEILKFAVGME